MTQPKTGLSPVGTSGLLGVKGFLIGNFVEKVNFVSTI
jgi:hypothetical protein